MSCTDSSAPISDLAEAYAAAKSVNAKDLDALLTSEPLFTIVVISDLGNIPMVLIGSEDSSFRVWKPYSGESKADLKAIVAWKREADKLYKDKARSMEEMDALRKVILSLMTIEPYMPDLDSRNGVMLACFMSIAYIWYCADTPVNPVDRDTFENDDKLIMPYLDIVQTYVERFTKLVSQYVFSGKEFNQSNPNG